MNRQFMLTKLAMARVVIQALYNMPGLPDPDHYAVKKQMKYNKSQLTESHKWAMKILQDRIARQTN